MLISEKLYTTASTRLLPAKVLADVVEALIGAAYIDDGLYKAQSCTLCFFRRFSSQGWRESLKENIG
ncbi:hypothetical protein BDW75DRAFT_246565 [Aspergillus navahoensis]